MEPDSSFLVALVLVFAAGGVVAAVRFRPLAIKIGAGVLALVLALVSGVALVNVYYGYYQTWSQLSADLTNSYAPFTTPSATGPHNSATGPGRIQRVQLDGAHSGISRTGFVYLPPQYFQPRYAHTRFPVVELLHGSPGSAANWILQINIASIMDQLIAKHFSGPVIVVMPTIDAGHTFQECTDAPGALDDTYISRDVPQDVRARFRASDVAAEWGIGGYSSGGYCAANLSLRHRSFYGAAGVMDGYFRPVDGPAAAALHFDANLEARNDPLLAVQRLGPGVDPLPAFWVSAGTASSKYALGSQAFVKALHGIQGVNFTSEPGAGHNFYAWRPAIPLMLAWMWQELAPPALRVHFPIAGPVDKTVLLAPKTGAVPPAPHIPKARQSPSTSSSPSRRTPAPHPTATTVQPRSS